MMKTEAARPLLDKPLKARRRGFLCYLFGKVSFAAGERAVLKAASASIEGDARKWEFYALERLKTGFMVPKTRQKTILFTNPDNSFQREVSPEVFGILCTLQGMAQLMGQHSHRGLTLKLRFFQLRKYAFSRPDADIFIAALN